MNTEVVKAMNKTKKKHTFRKWWNKNGYKVLRVVFFPIYFGSVIKEKTENYLNDRQKWSEERVKEILNYYIPRSAKWNNEDKSFYFFDNGYGWYIGFAKKYLKKKTADGGKITRVGVAVKFVSILLMNLNLKDLQKRSATAMTIGQN